MAEIKGCNATMGEPNLMGGHITEDPAEGESVRWGLGEL